MHSVSPSLVMCGVTILAGSYWIGSPVRPWTNLLRALTPNGQQCG